MFTLLCIWWSRFSLKSCIRLCIRSELAYSKHSALHTVRGLQIGVDNPISSVNNLKSTTNNSATNLRASEEVSRTTTDLSRVTGSQTHPKARADDSQQHSHSAYAWTKVPLGLRATGHLRDQSTWSATSLRSIIPTKRFSPANSASTCSIGKTT
jgi:hypothetical protein